MKQSTIAIIGAGYVGAAIAHTLVLRNLASAIMLVDIDKKKCQGEVDDLSDTLFFSNTSFIKQEELTMARHADIIIIAAGIAQKPGQTRLDLFTTNKKIISSIINGLKPINPEAIIIIVTNPVDPLTGLAQELSDLPRNQVFGSGTFLDTQRLCNFLSSTLQVGRSAISAYVLGEHGDSQFVPWSIAHINGTPLSRFEQLTPVVLDNIASQTKHKAYDIIACKGATAFGVAACVATYCQAIIFDQRVVLPMSYYYEPFKVCLSIPVVLAKQGVSKILMPSLTDQELEALHHSAAIIKQYNA